VPLLGPAQAHARALGLDAGDGAGADDLGRERVQVLPAAVVDAVVVRAQEGGDHGIDAARAVGERLAGEHRTELHHARSVIRVAVLPLRQADGLVTRVRHGCSPFAYKEDSARSPLPSCRWMNAF
jgi:hypothetical protein